MGSICCEVLQKPDVSERSISNLGVSNKKILVKQEFKDEKCSLDKGKQRLRGFSALMHLI